MTGMTGSLFVITAASGTGKTTLVKELLSRVANLSVSISHTTRAPRAGEVDGQHYHFVDKDTFLAHVAQGHFIEHAQVFDNYYGTMQQSVTALLAAGTDVILEIDWQGAEQVRRLFAEAISIFILPPSKGTLRERLAKRGQDSDAVIEQRLAGSITEIRQYINFDYLVVNDDFDTALAELTAIITANRLIIAKQQERLLPLLQRLLA